MRRFLPALLVLALGWAGSAQAQQTDSTRADSAQTDSAQTDSAQVSPQIVRGGAPSAPVSVRQVRRRIQRIGGGGAVRQVIYPLIVVPTVNVTGVQQPGAAAPRAPLSGAAPAPRRSPYVPRADRGTDPYYYDRLRNRFGDEDPGTRVRIRRNPDGTVDTLATDSLAATDSLQALPPPPEMPPPSQEPRVTVRRVERALLETGLFRAIGVNFEFNEENLLPESRTTLEIVGSVLERYPDLRVEVAGHTDNVGSDAYNQQLSEERALTIEQYITSNYNVAPERIERRGYGESQPLASNSTATGRALNRRVEFRVLNPEAAVQYQETVEETQEAPAPTPSPEEQQRMQQQRQQQQQRSEEELRETIREEMRRALDEAEQDTTSGS